MQLILNYFLVQKEGLHGEKGTNAGMIAGIVIGVLVFIAIVVVATFLVYRYKSKLVSQSERIK